jgi:Hemerythrin HHE cation binding domain
MEHDIVTLRMPRYAIDATEAPNAATYRSHCDLAPLPGGTVDITQLILDDHHEQRRLFAILEQVGRADTGVLSALWGRLAAFLELHAAAEEEIFYPELLQVGLAARRAAGVEGETLDAIHDHNEIRDAIAEVARHPVGSDAWFAAVGAVNLANSDHMAEEEREGLTDFRRLAGLQRRHQLAVAFAAFEARNFAGVPPVDKDPAGYVHEVEERLPTPPRGSLSIGSLKRG